MWRCAATSSARARGLRSALAPARASGAAPVAPIARTDARSFAIRASLLNARVSRSALVRIDTTSNARSLALLARNGASALGPWRECDQRRGLSTALESSVESIYQKKTPLEHVLLRPGMYIGSVEATKDTMWMVPDAMGESSSNGDGAVRMKQQVVEYVPALYKIFDEIIVNAVDNKVRDPSMRRLDVVIDAGSKANGYKPWISVHNDGRGIPIKFHKHEQVYVPELVLGHLLTGSNFDDSSARLTGGRHGYGAKLTNIFSHEFVVETGDASAGLQYKQVWRNNMRERGEPEITALPPGTSDFTRVSFSPDLAKFDMDKLTPGMVRVLRKRVFDVAGCLSDVDVTLNGTKVPIAGFESYIQAFQHATTTPSSASGDSIPTAVDYIYSRVNKRWQIGVLPSDMGFVQVSFVNGMSALRGGTHVNYVADQLCRRIADHVNKKHSELSVTAAHVKPHLALFINCMIENPTFDSQMKESMSSRPSTYGSTCILSERLSKLVIANSGIVERVVDAAKSKQRAALLKKVSSPRSKTTVNVPKLEDANLAGGPRSSECALILTEGDSAKALAVAGLAVVGRDTYGVFPLRGKFLNVRDATVAQLSNNAEFAHLCTILGLKMDETYDTVEKRQQLRYGKVVIMTDQDHDGSHIKGLLFNLFHTFWPHLLQSGDFLSEFITPIIKATPRRGSAKAKTDGVETFFSLPEYLDWKQRQSPDALKTYAIKYYKGLGTSTSAEGRAYFQDLAKHIVAFRWSGDADGDALDMVFSKTRASDRKHWLLHTYSPTSFLDTSAGVVTYSDFVHKELIQFSHADNARSLPSVVDGLKVSQRKVLFACLKRKLTTEVKVAQLAGYCSEHTAYHHGEASLHATIVNMAQDFVGANNVPLLVPSGQFGTRLQGGKDAASPRYIFTLLQKYTRLVFPEDDDALLTYVDDDGFAVEPVHYVPILPLLLVNGAEGIGTGWSTSIPNFHPIHVIDNLLALLDAETPLETVALAPMTPWYKGFRGAIVRTGEHAFTSHGVVTRVNATTLRVSELPVGKWVEDYKRVLWDLVSKKVIRSFSEHHTDRDVRFDITLSRQDVAKYTSDDSVTASLRKLLKLESSISTSNMHAFDATGKLQRYDSSDDVLRAFFPVRLALYAKRKAHLDQRQSKDVLKLANRIRFLEQVSHGELQMVLTERLPKAQLVALLKDHGFTPAAAFKDDTVHDDSVENNNHNGGDDDDDAFDYLLNTPLLSFTKENTEKLQREHAAKTEKLAHLRAMTPAQVWRHELEQLRAALLHDKDYRTAA